MVRYAILGSVELRDGAREIGVGGPRQVALLALLLVNANRALSTDRLIDALWHDLGPAGARKRLHAAIARLRRTLDADRRHDEPVLKTVAGGYLLAVAPGELDGEVFQTRIQDGRRALGAGDAERARDLLGHALGMWRGPALADVAYEEFAQPEIRRLEELRLAALEARVDCQLQLGEHGGVIGELEALVVAHPGRERLAGQLMLALYRCGRQGEALEVYARTRAYLSGELGLEPGPALQTVQAHILAQSPMLQPVSDKPGTAAAAATPAAEQAGVLPTGVVTFVLTDVEGSTGLWEADPDAMAAALERHDALIADLVERHGGRLLKKQGEGDATLSVFQRASDAVACAAELQHAAATESWPSQLDLRVRIALHSGEAQERTGDYFGPVLNRAARLRTLAVGGATVLSQSTAELVRDRLPHQLALVDIGAHELRGLSRPERVFELCTAAGASADGSTARPLMLDLPRSLHARVTTAPAALQGRRVRFRLPLAAAHFTGRSAELDAIGDALGRAGRAVVTQAITGMGGVGKSQLAAHYVHNHADEYDVVAWIRAEDGGIADLAELAAELGPVVAQLTPAERAGGAVRWLSGCDERWLLVLDNVAAPEQLRDCCPSSGNGRVIVTTRDRGMAQFGPALSVDVFDEQTAVEYLLATSGRADDGDGATRLARALGFLPLALSHAGAYCAAGTSFDDYVELLGALPAMDLFDSHPEASYAQTVASTWKVSIEAAERAAPLAGRVLAMAAYLAPDAIPRELFDVLNEDSAAAARKPLLDAFNALHRLSLAHVDDTTVSVHRLLQKTIRDDPGLRADEAAAASALTAVAAAFPRDHGQPQTWPQSERLLPHTLAIAAALEPPAAAGERLVTLLNSASEYLLRIDPGTRTIDTATLALDLAQSNLGPEHPDSLTAGGNLAVVYQATGQTTEATQLGEQVLADRERILGPKHPDTLRARANLTVSYRTMGRTAEAIELGQRVFADSERILGPEHPDTLRARGHLARSYRAGGRADDAIELGQRVFADSERILGPDHPDTLRAGAMLAVSYRAGGRSTDAIKLGQLGVTSIGRVLGPEHRYTMIARAILADSYRAAGRITDAISLGERLLADCERILGPEHPDTLRASTNLDLSYNQAGRTERLAAARRV